MKITFLLFFRPEKSCSYLIFGGEWRLNNLREKSPVRQGRGAMLLAMQFISHLMHQGSERNANNKVKFYWQHAVFNTHMATVL